MQYIIELLQTTLMLLLFAVNTPNLPADIQSQIITVANNAYQTAIVELSKQLPATSPIMSPVVDSTILVAGATNVPEVAPVVFATVPDSAQIVQSCRAPEMRVYAPENTLVEVRHSLTNETLSGSTVRGYAVTVLGGVSYPASFTARFVSTTTQDFALSVSVGSSTKIINYRTTACQE